MAERWPALMSPEDAAEYLSISVASLKRLKAAGRLRTVAIRDGSILRYRRGDLDAFIDSLPWGNGTCAANEKRLAVVMLAKQQKSVERKASAKKPKPSEAKQTQKPAKNTKSAKPKSEPNKESTDVE